MVFVIPTRTAQTSLAPAVARSIACCMLTALPVTPTKSGSTATQPPEGCWSVTTRYSTIGPSDRGYNAPRWSESGFRPHLPPTFEIATGRRRSPAADYPPNVVCDSLPMDHGTPQLFILFYRRRTPKITGGLNIFSNPDDIDPRGTFKLHRTHKSIDVADFHWDLLQPRPLLNVAASETRRNDTPHGPPPAVLPCAPPGETMQIAAMSSRHRPVQPPKGVSGYLSSCAFQDVQQSEYSLSTRFACCFECGRTSRLPAGGSWRAAGATRTRPRPRSPAPRPRS